MTRLVPLAMLIACTGAPSATPPQPDAVIAPQTAAEGVIGSYTLTFPETASQYFDVELVLPQAPPDTAVAMANWTPGSYLIRDYARHIEGVSITVGGVPNPVVKTAKNRWTVASAPEGPADWVVRYKVYAHEGGVRGNWVEPDYAVLNGAPTFLADLTRSTGTWDVRFVLPDAWTKISTGLRPHPSGEDHRFRAHSYDELVDSPVMLGDHDVHSWVVTDPTDTARAVTHRIVHEGSVQTWDREKANADVEKVAAAVVEFWKGMPYPDYTFLNVINGSYGGLEHKNSTLMTASLWATDKRADRIKWLGLVSHEFFHTWNVKRLRPQELGPFDYEDEVHTKGLWVAEGITSYYDDLLVSRAGLMDTDEYLAKLSDNLKAAMTPPGRKVRSLEDASYDAWIKHYRKDENFGNVAVSYYTKGAAIAWLLDAELRQRSGGYTTLDDAMRLAYSRHSGDAGFTSQDFQAACEDAANLSRADLDAFFEGYVRGTADPDLSTALRVYGLKLRAAPDDQSDVPWLGIGSSAPPGVTVTSVVAGGPAWNADVLVGDELIAIDGYRVPRGGLSALVKRFDVGTEVTLTLSRRGQLRTTQVVFGTASADQEFALEIDPMASIEARETRRLWLGARP